VLIEYSRHEQDALPDPTYTSRSTEPRIFIALPHPCLTK
jgi:hypothetical protein